MNICIAGAGPGAFDLLTVEARLEIKNADIVLASDHVLKTISGLNHNIRIMSISETLQYIDEHRRDDSNVCVVASGDTGFYSIAHTISRHVGEINDNNDVKKNSNKLYNTDSKIDIKLICGISSMQYFAARIRRTYSDMKFISLHGKEGSIVPYVCYNRSVFSLTGGNIKAHDIICELIDAGLGNVFVNVGENLSLPDEHIVSGTAYELRNEIFSDLAVVTVDNEQPADPSRRLSDEDFKRGNVPMTKFAIRSLALDMLEIKPHDICFDIGAGTGGMTCSMAMRAHDSFVYAIEKKKEACDLIRTNMTNLGTLNIKLKHGTAPEDLDDFPAPTKVFIGGSSGSLSEIMGYILSVNPRAVILVTAVTMETVAETFCILKSKGFSTETLCANIANAQKVGSYHLMKAENPVYLIKGEKLEK